MKDRERGRGGERHRVAAAKRAGFKLLGSSDFNGVAATTSFEGERDEESRGGRCKAGERQTRL